MKCQSCKTEMQIKQGEPISDSQYRQVFQCRNPNCGEYGKEIEVLRHLKRKS